MEKAKPKNEYNPYTKPEPGLRSLGLTLALWIIAAFVISHAIPFALGQILIVFGVLQIFTASRLASPDPRSYYGAMTWHDSVHRGVIHGEHWERARRPIFSRYALVGVILVIGGFVALAIGI